MKVEKTALLCVFAVVLLAGLFSVFLFQSWGKSTGHEIEAIAEQGRKLAEQDRRLAEQGRMLTEQDKRFVEQDKKLVESQRTLGQQNKRLAELEELGKIVGGIQAKLNLRKEDIPAVGVVSIRKIFQDCKKNARYREETAAEQNKVISELEALSKEIEAEKGGLATLKAGSSDHTALVKEIFLKRASLQAQQEFYKQQLSLKDQRWTEELYQEILRITRQVAEQKGLGLVFVKGEVELPALSVNELMLTIRTHKLLYGGGCLDITDEVMARLDKEK